MLYNALISKRVKPFRIIVFFYLTQSWSLLCLLTGGVGHWRGKRGRKCLVLRHTRLDGRDGLSRCRCWPTWSACWMTASPGCCCGGGVASWVGLLIVCWTEGTREEVGDLGLSGLATRRGGGASSRSGSGPACRGRSRLSWRRGRTGTTVVVRMSVGEAESQFAGITDNLEKKNTK